MKADTKLASSHWTPDRVNLFGPCMQGSKGACDDALFSRQGMKFSHACRPLFALSRMMLLSKENNDKEGHQKVHISRNDFKKKRLPKNETGDQIIFLLFSGLLHKLASIINPLHVRMRAGALAETSILFPEMPKTEENSA